MGGEVEALGETAAETDTEAESESVGEAVEQETEARIVFAACGHRSRSIDRRARAGRRLKGQRGRRYSSTTCAGSSGTSVNSQRWMSSSTACVGSVGLDSAAGAVLDLSNNSRSSASGKLANLDAAPSRATDGRHPGHRSHPIWRPTARQLTRNAHPHTDCTGAIAIVHAGRSRTSPGSKPPRGARQADQ